ncbi:formin-like protein 8 [Syzygium oleosum]|uniref:formin-like protein 8 n=1 Tax=Syzygium oleosum TaxID=219896 RepID=UPI0024BB6220|nr:formin-like protein 8 [Syzygium oleosum]
MVGSRKSLLATVLTVILILLSAAAGPSTARELRPADHGLEYQSSPPSGVNPSPDMTSFFGTSASALPPPPPSSSSPYAPATDTAMTGPMESSGSWQPHHSSGGGGGGGRDRVRDVLVVASIACGAAGVVLMGASAFLFLFRFKRERARTEPQSTSQQEK